MTAQISLRDGWKSLFSFSFLEDMVSGGEASELCYSTANPACGRKHVVSEHISYQIGVRVNLFYFASINFFFCPKLYNEFSIIWLVQKISQCL